MGDAISGGSGAQARRGRPNQAGSSVLTPPVGIPAVPAQRGSDRVPAMPPSAPPTPPSAVVAPCVCGHARQAHEHYRRGTDCGACGVGACPGFRKLGGLLRRALRGLGLVP